jgi:hypothetical protein
MWTLELTRTALSQELGIWLGLGVAGTRSVLSIVRHRGLRDQERKQQLVLKSLVFSVTVYYLFLFGDTFGFTLRG